MTEDRDNRDQGRTFHALRETWEVSWGTIFAVILFIVALIWNERDHSSPGPILLALVAAATIGIWNWAKGLLVERDLLFRILAIMTIPIVIISLIASIINPEAWKIGLGTMVIVQIMILIFGPPETPDEKGE